MNHLEFAALESAMLDESPWDRWIDSLEATCGMNLDDDHPLSLFATILIVFGLALGLFFTALCVVITIITWPDLITAAQALIGGAS